MQQVNDTSDSESRYYHKFKSGVWDERNDEIILREEIYVYSFCGPFGLKDGCIENYFRKRCALNVRTYAIVGKAPICDVCIGLKVVAFGTFADLNKLRLSIEPPPDSPCKWIVLNRHNASITDSSLRIKKGTTRLRGRNLMWLHGAYIWSCLCFPLVMFRYHTTSIVD